MNIFILLVFLLSIGLVCAGENISDDTSMLEDNLSNAGESDVLADTAEPVFIDDITPCDMPQIEPCVSFNVNDSYNVSDGDSIQLEIGVNAKWDMFVEVPGLLEKSRAVIDDDFKIHILLSNFTRSGKYFVICSLPEGASSKYPVVAGSGDIPGVYKKEFTINYQPKSNNISLTESVKNNPLKSSLKVKKASPVLTANKKSFKVKNKFKRYSVSLKYKNKALSNVKVLLKVNGKSYKAFTNSKGVCVFKLSGINHKKTYMAKVMFKGTKNFNAVSKKVKITVK